MARRRSYSLALSARVGAIRREIAVAAGMLVLLTNLLTGFALSTRPILALDGGGASLLKAICGTAPAGQSSDLPENVPASQNDAHCLFCLPLFSGAVLAGSAGVVLLQRFAFQRRLVPPQHVLLGPSGNRGRPPARGPPSI